MKTNDFSQSRIVDEGDYLKVGASMTGIHAMRTRPGLTLDATIVSGESMQLQTLSPYEVSFYVDFYAFVEIRSLTVYFLGHLQVQHARGVHKLAEFSRIRPSPASAWA